MGRRRRRVIRIVKKKLPTVFVCPKCGEEAVRVSIAKDTGKATVLCALCGLKDEFPSHPAAQMIDVYSYFTDRFYGVKDPRPIMPKEREVPMQEVEELTEPEEEPAVPETAIVESPEQPPAVIAESEAPIVPIAESEAPVQASEQPAAPVEETEQTAAQPTTEPSQQVEAETEEEAEPFADILQNRDKKRYSPNPLPDQSSEADQSASS